LVVAVADVGMTCVGCVDTGTGLGMPAETRDGIDEIAAAAATLPSVPVGMGASVGIPPPVFGLVPGTVAVGVVISIGVVVAGIDVPLRSPTVILGRDVAAANEPG
jgi:hypothetical protein